MMRVISMIAALALTTAAKADSTAERAAPTRDWHEMALEAALEVHRVTIPGDCAPETFGGADLEPVWWELFIGEETAAREALLVQYLCRASAYNQFFVFVMVDQCGVANPVLFPSPQVEVAYAGGMPDGAVETIELTGSVDRREVANPAYDPASRVMVEHNNWRGLGDAASTTRWGYVMGRFEVARFEVDASYDGEINPTVLIDRDIW